MIPEAIQHGIPDRAMTLNEQGLTQRNPDFIDNKIATPEILDPQILRLFYGLAMFVQKEL